ncbi:MAG: TIGR00266 family protein, partial [Caldilineaceae bacterium]|nr:TIGR00266 family protein [Caldilineaceae bacterium]
GESFFINTFSATAAGQSIALAPPLPGDIAVIEMTGQPLLVQSGAYLASSEGVVIDTKWTGAKTFFGSEGLLMLRATGTGTLIVSSYGAIHPIELAAGESYVIDTGHLVTFDESVTYQVRKVAGWKSTLFSGEGLVAELTGPGRLTMQSRSQDAFLSWLTPHIPKQTTTVSTGSS